jgi:IS30 family transposase
MAKKDYHNLNFENRCKIEALRNAGYTQKMIAQQLGIDQSTVSRELSRNSSKGEYKSQTAQNKSSNRRKLARSNPVKMTEELVSFIERMLTANQWSPEQIAGRIKIDQAKKITAQTIYKHIRKDKKNGGELYKNLRHRGKRYNKRVGKSAGRGLIPNRKDIADRPAIVNEKKRLGDWEFDLVHVLNGFLLTGVERYSKLSVIGFIPSKHAPVVTAVLCRLTHDFDDAMITITTDNGKEFALHEIIAATLNLDFYFAAPYHSWERGLNEHTNGLIRQYLPKDNSYDIITDEYVRKIQHKLNMRPRKCLNFMTPLEVFNRARFKL